MKKELSASKTLMASQTAKRREGEDVLQDAAEWDEETGRFEDVDGFAKRAERRRRTRTTWCWMLLDACVVLEAHGLFLTQLSSFSALGAVSAQCQLAKNVLCFSTY